MVVCAPRADELAAPVRLKAGGEWIDTDVGHAAPYFADFDGDGLADLYLVDGHSLPESTGEGNRLLAYAFHKTAIACENIRIMIDQVITITSI